MTSMLIARHGQSEWNAQGRWQGQADPPLSDLGREQTLAASRRLGSIDVIVSSDLERAYHTAQIISAQLGVGPVVIEPLLRERDAGEWSGLTREDIDRDWPGYLAEKRRPPGFEDEASLLHRTHQALDRIELEYHGADVLVVAHGGLVYALEDEHGLPFERLPNLGARLVIHRGDRLELGERLLLADDNQIVATGHVAPL